MISQELFDETMPRRMKEVFDLSPDEPLQETIEQFEKIQSIHATSRPSRVHVFGARNIGAFQRQAFTQDLNLLGRCVREDETI
jgi:hypothetical protein